MKTLEELQKIALELDIDISDCQDINCLEKRINEVTAYITEKLREEYKEEIKKEKIKENVYQKNSAKNLRNMINEDQKNKSERDKNY